MVVHVVSQGKTKANFGRKNSSKIDMLEYYINFHSNNFVCRIIFFLNFFRFAFRYILSQYTIRSFILRQCLEFLQFQFFIAAILSFVLYMNPYTLLQWRTGYHFIGNKNRKKMFYQHCIWEFG